MSEPTELHWGLAELAQALATGAHAGQEDKAGRAYITHPGRVAARVEEYGADFVAVAWLHDVLEDTKVGVQELMSIGFPKGVIDGVVSLTKLPGEAHTEAVARAAKDPYGIVVKAADVADNADPGRLALLDDERATKLRIKYDRARRILDEFGAPRFD